MKMIPAILGISHLICLTFAAVASEWSQTPKSLLSSDPQTLNIQHTTKNYNKIAATDSTITDESQKPINTIYQKSSSGRIDITTSYNDAKKKIDLVEDINEAEKEAEEDDDDENDDDGENNQEDIDEDTELNSTNKKNKKLTPQVIHSSKKSYLKEFLIQESKLNKNNPDPQTLSDPHISPQRLKSSINSVGNTISNSQNLRPYTELMVKQSKQNSGKYKDISYKKYGHNVQNPEISYHYQNKLNLPKFIEYLKNQGFDESQLDFLLQKDELNYGFDEIEKELNKLHQTPPNTQNPTNEIIDIGGEEPISNSAVFLNVNLQIITIITLLVIVHTTGSYTF